MTTVCVPDEPFGRVLAEALPKVDVVVWDGDGPPPQTLASVEFLVPPYATSSWTSEQLAHFTGVRAIQLMSAGYEAWLPILPAAPADVVLCNGRGVHGSSTAELAITGLLMHWHDMPVLLDQQREHRWLAHDRDTARDKSVLVLGAGDIGAKVADVLSVLGARTTLVGRHARPGVHAVDELPDLCEGQDALVVAIPLTEQTRGLVNAALLARLPDRAIVVNVARGPIVVTDALVQELATRRLRAVLDVTDPEPLPADHPLWNMPDLILTPHVGGGAAGWRELAERLVVEQVRRFVAGEPLENIVRQPGSAPGSN